MSCTVAAFMEHLRESELFPTERIETHWEASRSFLPFALLASQADARPLADWFVRSAILTSWQAKQLLNGCSRGFFLGRYRLLKLLGHGGMSVVYLAFDPIRNNGVALKVLTPRRVRKSSIYDRFRLEAEALCRVRHPNVIRAYALEYGQQSGRGERSITGAYEMRPHSLRSGEDVTVLEEIERQTDCFTSKLSSTTSSTFSEDFSIGLESSKTRFSTNLLTHTKLAVDVDSADQTHREHGESGSVVEKIASQDETQDETQDDADGYWFLVMEYVEGRNLGALIQDYGPLSIEVATEYLRQAAEGVAAVHAAGFVHRDIKPSNFIVEWTGQIRLLDMGLARFGEETPDGLTPLHADRIFGTADYLAPEQIRNSHIVDGRADLYGLGGTFYAMLTGNPPFPADTVGEKLEAQLYQTVPDLRLLRADVPQPLARLGRKLLAKKPYQRPCAAREVADALQTYVTQMRSTYMFSTTETIDDKDKCGIQVENSLGSIDVNATKRPTNVRYHKNDGSKIPLKRNYAELDLPLELSLPDDSPRLLSECSNTQTRLLPQAMWIPIAHAIPQATVWVETTSTKELISPETPTKPLSEEQVIHFLLDDESPPEADVSVDLHEDVFDPSLFDVDEDRFP